MSFCPECEAEYREGIKVCPDCNVDLVAELTPETRTHDKSDAEFVQLRSFSTSGEAEMVCELLERNGLRAFVEGGRFAVRVGGFSEEVIVMVDQRDVVRAIELYSAYFESQQPAPSAEDQTDNQ